MRQHLLQNPSIKVITLIIATTTIIVKVNINFKNFKIHENYQLLTHYQLSF